MCKVRIDKLLPTEYDSVIRSDGIGYYNYYVSIFETKNISNQKADNVSLVKTSEGRVVNKYFVGVALLQSPFVLPVYIYKSLLNRSGSQTIDLKSNSFQNAVAVSGFFYLFLGLFCLRLLLKSFKIDEITISISLILILFGTNLFYYSLIEPAMSHVYSFALITAVLLKFKQLSVSFNSKDLFGIAFIMALIILVRPLNIVIILAFPFICLSFSSFFETVLKILKLKWNLFFAAIIFVSIVSIQFLMWKQQTGSFIVWSYVNEGFYWLNPQILPFLIGFRKGLFIYSPFLLLSLVLFITVFRNKKEILFSLLLFLGVLTYILSSWWSWYYGDSYGCRVMIDFLAVFSIMFALAINHFSTKMKAVVSVVGFCFVALNLIQTYQYCASTISHFDMNSEKYCYTFGKIGEKYYNILGGNDDIIPYHKNGFTTIYQNEVKLENGVDSILKFNTSMVDTSFNSSKLIFTKENEFGLNFLLSNSDFGNCNLAYVELKNKIHLFEGDMKDVFVVIDCLDSGGNNTLYKVFKINELPLNIGSERENNYKFTINKPNSVNGKVQVYIWNRGKAKFSISNLNIKISGIN